MMRCHAAQFNNNGTDFTAIFICRHIKEGSEGGFHFWTRFVGFTVVYLGAVWLFNNKIDWNDASSLQIAQPAHWACAQYCIQAACHRRLLLP